MVSGTTRSGLATNEPEQLIPDGALVCSVALSVRLSTIPSSARRPRPMRMTIATKMIESNSLRPLSGVTPTQSIPRKCMEESLLSGD